MPLRSIERPVCSTALASTLVSTGAPFKPLFAPALSAFTVRLATPPGTSLLRNTRKHRSICSQWSANPVSIRGYRWPQDVHTQELYCTLQYRSQTPKADPVEASDKGHETLQNKRHQISTTRSAGVMSAVNMYTLASTHCSHSNVIVLPTQV